MSFSPKIANEIARLMRDPDALRSSVTACSAPAGAVTTIPTSRASRLAIHEAGSLRRRDIAVEIPAAMRA